MMYAMNTKTFEKIFVKESLANIQKTQFLVVSNKIVKSEELENVMFAKHLYPPDMLLADVMASDKEFFEKEYREHLDKRKIFLAALIMGVIEDRYPLMMICTYKEWHIGYMQILIKYIEDTFGYYVVDYKKYKQHIELPRADFDENAIRESYCRAKKILKEETVVEKRRMEKTREGRRELLRNMGTSDMRKKLKSMGIYANDLDKKTMKDLLKEFYVNS